MKKQAGMEARKLFMKNLNRLMEQNGITQSDLVERLGVSSATASDWVNGVKYPRVDAMQALAELLDISMSDLMIEHTNGNGFSEMLEKLRRSPGRRTMFSLTKNADEKKLSEINRVIEAMIGTGDDEPK